MDRRSSSILLIPLIAALAFFFPSGTSTRTGQSVRQSEIHHTNDGNNSNKNGQDWQGGRLAIQRFFGFSDDTQDFAWPGKIDPRANSTIQFIVATIPDPIDSGLSYSYDRDLAVIQSAVRRQDYVLVDFDLPWEDCSEESNHASSQTTRTQVDLQALKSNQISLVEDEGCPRRFAKEPGLLLFAKSKEDPNGNADKSATELLLFYIIGETPTAGIQKQAFTQALDEIASLCGWKTVGRNPLSKAPGPAAACKSDNELRILGPRFTGSAQSIDLTLSYWISSLPPEKQALTVKIVSGSATSILPPAKTTKPDACNQQSPPSKRESTPGSKVQANTFAADKATDFYRTQYLLQGRFSFYSMENSDKVKFPAFIDFLRQQTSGTVRVALLTEGTAYGGAIFGVIQDAIKEVKKKSQRVVQITNLPYPLHISQLRAESFKARQAAQEAMQQTTVPSRRLSLEESLEDKGTRREIDTLSPATSVTSEEILSNILSAISREGDNYVGIVASDVRDVIFLAREVREHSPKVVLFTFNSDLLYLHPEINQSLRGMLVVSSYPMNSSNQLWSLPSNLGLRLQFADDASESIYNATLALLNDDLDLVDYSLPFPVKIVAADLHPPIWITVVGRDRIWPISAQAPGDLDYTYQPQLDSKSIDPEKWWWRGGVYPEGSLIFISIITALGGVFSFALVCRSRQSNPLDTKWIGGILAPPFSEKYRSQADSLLLVACSSLLGFLAVTFTLLSIPAARLLWAHDDVSIGVHLFAGILVGLVGVFTLSTLAWAIGSLFRSVRKRSASKQANTQEKLTPASWLPMMIGSAVILSLALVLSVSWIWESLTGCFREVLFTSIRYLDLTNGVSALVALLLVSAAGFLWSVSSFHRLRMLEGMCHRAGFLSLATPRFRCVHSLEEDIRHSLQQPSLRFRLGSIVVCVLATVSIVYLLFFQLVPSFEDTSFYWLFRFAYLFVSVVLWLGVLRFFSVWLKTHHLLQQLALTPMRNASKRFRNRFPSWPKIDLAMPAPSLAPLALSIDMLQTITRHAHQLVDAIPAELPGPVKPNDIASNNPLQLSGSQLAALRLLASAELGRKFDAAQEALAAAQDADAERSKDAGRWRCVLKYQCQTQGFLAGITGTVSEALELEWWKELRSPRKNSDAATSLAEEVFEYCEDFVAARVSNFLAHVFPQMQNLIYTSVAGLLLMLFAISAYSFQPHNQLLFFNWIVVLSFVGIAVWVFIQMNRDPVLSNLNGTKPGQITWDREFVFRLFTYAVVPILALLGAQFPDTVGQILARIMPAGALHP